MLLLVLSRSVVSDSVRPHRRQPTRLPRPWDSPGKNTGVGCHFLLQCMKVKSESEVTQSCPNLSDPMDCSLPGSSRPLQILKSHPQPVTKELCGSQQRNILAHPSLTMPADPSYLPGAQAQYIKCVSEQSKLLTFKMRCDGLGGTAGAQG